MADKSDLERLTDVVNDWLGTTPPPLTATAKNVADILLREARNDPGYCSDLINGHEGGMFCRAGLDVEDVLFFGMIVATTVVITGEV